VAADEERERGKNRVMRKDREPCRGWREEEAGEPPPPKGSAGSRGLGHTMRPYYVSTRFSRVSP